MYPISKLECCLLQTRKHWMYRFVVIRVMCVTGKETFNVLLHLSWNGRFFNSKEAFGVSVHLN